MKTTLYATIEDVLTEYETRQAEEDRAMAGMSPQEIGCRRDEFLVSVGRATGLFLYQLVQESAARSILELGTGLGYSTIWLAAAVRATHGRVISIDKVAAKQDQARVALRRTGLLEFVEFKLADAEKFLASTRGAYDFVLLDLWKDLYVPCIDLLLEQLTPGAIVVSDNMLAPSVVRLTAAHYLGHVRRIPELETVVLPIGSGLALSRYRVATQSQ